MRFKLQLQFRLLAGGGINTGWFKNMQLTGDLLHGVLGFVVEAFTNAGFLLSRLRQTFATA
ncbi:hypothetical protein [Spirosoma koreense]